jgi:hypothetical protein
LIISDVDETVADLYLPADPSIIHEIQELLNEGKRIFFITGQSKTAVHNRIVNFIAKSLRQNILIGHCSGAEVWGYNAEGDFLETPYYSLYDSELSQKQKDDLRLVVNQLIQEFELKVYPATPIKVFNTNAGNNPLAIMLEDRGPQITFEVINGYELTPDQMTSIEREIPLTHGKYDLRIPILERAEVLLNELNIPISP